MGTYVGLLMAVIRGELLALGHDVSAASVRRYRRRPPSQRWHTFITNHRHDLWAVDFFTVPTLLFRTLYVFVLVSHDRRRIEHINVSAHPTVAWVWQQVIEATPGPKARCPASGPRPLLRSALHRASGSRRC